MPKAGLIIPDRNDAVLLRMIAEHEGFWERGTELRESGKTEETEGFDSACDALRDQIRVTQPATFAGAIAQLEFAAQWDDPEMVAAAVAGLREIASGDDAILSLFRQWIEAQRAESDAGSRNPAY